MDLFDHDVMLGGVLLKGEERKKNCESESSFGFSESEVALKKDGMCALEI